MPAVVDPPVLVVPPVAMDPAILVSPPVPVVPPVLVSPPVRGVLLVVTVPPIAVKPAVALVPPVFVLPLLPPLLLPLLLPLLPIFGLPPGGFTSPDDGAAPVAAPPLTLVANGASSSERAPQASGSTVEAISRYNFGGGNVLQLRKGSGGTRDSFLPWTVQSNVLQPALG